VRQEVRHKAIWERTAQMTDPSCGALKKIESSSVPVRHHAKIKCLTCRSILYEDNTLRDCAVRILIEND
jgi:hypothetical protein